MKTLTALLIAASLWGCAGLRASDRERSDELFARIELGMTQPEVLRLLGAPDGTMAFSRSSTLARDYPYQDSWGYFSVFSITSDAGGRAVGKLSWRTNDGGDHP